MEQIKLLNFNNNKFRNLWVKEVIKNNKHPLIKILILIIQVVIIHSRLKLNRIYRILIIVHLIIILIKL